MKLDLKGKLKTVLKKEHGREFTDEEVENVASFMRKMAEIEVSSFLEGQMRQQKLKEFPDGFHLDKEGYCCSICGSGATGEDSWFDQYGLKCGICQGAINRKEIPPNLGQDKEGWYMDWELEHHFCLKPLVLRQWVKKRLLNMRTITRNGKGVHQRIFLIQENEDMLPPKHLLRSYTVTEMIDGKEWHCSRPWYQFVDPHKHLKGYKIMNYLRVVPAVDEKTDPTATSF